MIKAKANSHHAPLGAVRIRLGFSWLEPVELVQMEEIEVFPLDGLLEDAGEGFGIGFQLEPVAGGGLGKGLLRHPVGLEIQDGDAVPRQRG